MLHAILEAAAFLAVTSVLGCGSSEGPCKFSNGTKFTIDILGPAMNNSQAGPSCGTNFDIIYGQILDATVVAYADDMRMCYIGVVTFGPVGPWTWTLASGNEMAWGGAVAQGQYDATSSACVGQVAVQVERNDNQIAGTAGWVLRRQFTASPGQPAASCPASCEDTFPANVQ